MTVVETLAELVAIDSVSTRSNKKIIEYLSRRCERRGFHLRQFPYTDETGTEKVNLVAMAGGEFSSDLQVELAIVGHTDTVPYEASWTEATNLTEREGKLFGRGACDTKGFIAAAITAIEDLNLEMLARPLALIFTADEEIGLRGAKELADQKPFRVRYSIVGEPTSLQPIRAGKGYSLAEVIVRGREGHSAYPALGASAVFRAARLISRVERIAEELKQHEHRDFDPPFTTLNVGLINGGTAKNIIAGECKFTLEWRPIPTQPSAHVVGMVQAAIEEERTIDPEFDCDVQAGRADSGFETPANSVLVSLLEKASGKSSGTVSFGTEAPQMIALGGEAVVMGPGNIRVAHRTGEFVPVDELENCVSVLSRAINELCY